MATTVRVSGWRCTCGAELLHEVNPNNPPWYEGMVSLREMAEAVRHRLGANDGKIHDVDRFVGDVDGT